MENLSKKERENIATLFNSIVVANRFIDDAVREKNSAMFDLWWESLKRDTVELFEVYGIELPSLQTFVYEAA